MLMKKHCKDADVLINYLRSKGGNHNHYKWYASMNRIKNLIDTKQMYLSNGKKWNDITNRKDFNQDTDDFVNFGICFSFSRDESVAMWMLYSGIDKSGGMIDFTKKGISSIRSVRDVNVGYFVGNKFHSAKELDESCFKTYVTDIVYYTERSDGYTVSRSDEICYNLSRDVFSRLSGCKKVYPWKYENECRLIVSVNKKYLTPECTHIRIDISDMDLGSSMERIYTSPNYPHTDMTQCRPSTLAKTVDWSLCDPSQCTFAKNNIKSEQGE